MNACNEERLSRYLDGELNPAEVEAVDEHLKACAACRARLDEFTELHALGQEAYPTTTFQAPPVVARRGSRSRLALLAAAAVLVAVFGGTAWVAIRTLSPEQTAKESPSPSPARLQTAREEAAPVSQTTPQPQADSEAVAAPDTESDREPLERTDSMTITGTVADFHGKPVAGAHIFSVGTSSDPGAPGGLEIHGTARSDKTGAFALFCPVGTEQIHVYADGFVAENIRAYLPIQDAAVELEVRLAHSQQIRGRVLDPTGRPLSGVRVTSGGDFVPGQGRVATTSDSGRFVFPSNSYWRLDKLWLEHPEYATASIPIPRDGTTPDAFLRPGGTLRVRVVRGARGVEGALVRLQAPSKRLPRPRTAWTDENGYVLFEQCPPLNGFLLSAHTPEGDVSDPPEGELRIVEGEVSECLLRIPARHPGMVRGTIQDVEGRPIPGARVFLTRSTTPEYYQTVPVRDDGTFEAGLSAGHAILSVNAPGYEAGMPDESLRRKLMVQGTGVRLTEDFRLKRIEPTTIAFRNQWGDPVTRTLIAGDLLGASWSGSRFWLLSETGTFSTPWRMTSIWAFDPASGYGKSIRPLPESRGSTLILDLDAPVGSIQGRVVDGEGNPIKHVFVRAFLNEQVENPFRKAAGESDEDGYFELHPLSAAARYQVAVNHLGYHPSQDRIIEEARAAGDGGRSSVEIVLLALNAELSGTVVATDGAFLAGAVVALYDKGGEIGQQVSDGRGRFRFPAVEGSYALLGKYLGVMSPDYVPVEAPATGLVLTLPIDAASALGPRDTDAKAAANMLKQMGLVFKMFALEAKGGKFPALAREFGRLHPELTEIYPEYLADTLFMAQLRGDTETKLVYLGYTVTDDTTGAAFLDVYEEFGPEAIYDEDIIVPEGSGVSQSSTIFRLREGIERFLITDINNPAASALAQSTMPVLWEMPGTRDESGGLVLYMDGHVTWQPYPGEFPMTVSFIQRLQEIMAN